LSVALALRAGLFNIGAESQLAAGGFAAALVGLALPAGLPSLLVLPLYILAAALAGGVVGGIPGVLKARFGAHEVITTIMLNFIVLALLNYLISTRFKVQDTLHTPELASGALPRLSDVWSGFHGSAANAVILLALLVVAAAWWFLFRMRAGFELRAVGLQPHAAEYGGVNVESVWWRAMVLSGAVAGIGGLNYVLGYKHYYEEGFSAGAGFLGIAVALVGRSHPVGIVIAAILFATLSQGGLAVNALVPKQMVDVLQAVVIISMATAVPEVRRVLAAVRR
ncbi:MAG TPA: ABC transporter permease, partial [Gemmatimonadaceae bacterium]|nr:ABC transporter permease [Gemmatimonadaceae bacterium]